MQTITGDGMTEPIRRKNNLLRLFLLGMLGCLCAGCLHASGVKEKESLMENGCGTLWGVVNTLGEEMPLSKEVVEAVLRTELTDKTRDEYLWHLIGAGHPLDDGSSVSRVSLALLPGGEFGKNSGLSIELEGRCIGLDEIREHFGELTIVQYPRGRSLQETTVYAAAMPWGELSFAFKEEKRDCLFRILFRKKMP